MTVPDEELFAFVDGELPPEAMARIEAAMETDPQLALRVETQRALRRLLSGAHAGALASPPRRLAPTATAAEPPKPAVRPAEVIAFPGAKAKEKAKAKARETTGAKPAQPPHGARRRVQPWMAMVACLVAGLFIGRVAIPTLPSVSGEDAAAPIATGPLAQALSRQTAGADQGPIRIGLSFKDQAGLYCRTFQASGSAPVSGVACREKAAWRVRVVSAAAPTVKAAKDATSLAASAAVLAAVDAMIAGAPLDAAGEAKAKAAGWKPL